jgi:hypothetical protein
LLSKHLKTKVYTSITIILPVSCVWMWNMVLRAESRT